MKTQHWEYFSVQAQQGFDMNELGQAGWELICVINAHGSSGWCNFYFKRQIIE